ncbi:MAG TPA: hypothetical protein VF933_25265, partial [Streptosporangiaceae bacterium]
HPRCAARAEVTRRLREAFAGSAPLLAGAAEAGDPLATGTSCPVWTLAAGGVLCWILGEPGGSRRDGRRDPLAGAGVAG